MSNRIANTVRAVFALFMLSLGLYAGADSLVAGPPAAAGLSSRCGSAEQPCALAPLTVTTTRTSTRMVSATAADQRVAAHALAIATAES